MAEWKLPTGYNDPSNVWASETNAYDGSTTTRAGSSVRGMSWSGYLELTIDPIHCSKIRFFANYSGFFAIDRIKVDVYYDYSWHEVHSGSFLDEVWIEKGLGGVYYVNKIRFKFRNGAPLWSLTCLLYEAEFYQTIGTPLLTTKDATDVEDTTATLNGEIDDRGGGVCTERGFIYKEGEGGGEQEVKETGSFVEGEYSLDISGLDNTKIYYFKAYAINAADTGEGEWKSFGKTIVTPTVTTNAATSVDEEKATLNGNITVAGGQNPEERGFEWKEGIGGNVSKLKETGSFPIGTFSLVLSDLDPNTTYYFRAYAINDAGTGTGNWLSFIIGYANPTVKTHNATDEQQNQVTGNGEIVSTGGADCDERGFEYGLTKTATWLKNEVAGGYGVGHFNLTINGLETNTEYWYRAYAKRYKE